MRVVSSKVILPPSNGYDGSLKGCLENFEVWKFIFLYAMAIMVTRPKINYI